MQFEFFTISLLFIDDVLEIAVYAIAITSERRYAT